MKFEQLHNEPENFQEKEINQEKLTEIGKRVLENIAMTRKQIEKLEERKKNIIENTPEGEDPSLNKDMQYIENVMPAFVTKLESLEGLAGQDVAE
jgi:hypothetical protein